jgi:hypothetical protein
MSSVGVVAAIIGIGVAFVAAVVAITVVPVASPVAVSVAIASIVTVAMASTRSADARVTGRTTGPRARRSTTEARRRTTKVRGTTTEARVRKPTEARRRTEWQGERGMVSSRNDFSVTNHLKKSLLRHAH